MKTLFAMVVSAIAVLLILLLIRIGYDRLKPKKRSRSARWQSQSLCAKIVIPFHYIKGAAECELNNH